MYSVFMVTWAFDICVVTQILSVNLPFGKPRQTHNTVHCYLRIQDKIIPHLFVSTDMYLKITTTKTDRLIVKYNTQLGYVSSHKVCFE